MSFIAQVLQGIQYTGLQTRRSVFLKTQFLGNTVGGDKPDAKDIGSQLVRIFLHNRNSLITILLKNFRRKGTADTMIL